MALGLFFATKVAIDNWPLTPITARSLAISLASGILIGAFALATVLGSARRWPAALTRLLPRISMPVWKRMLLALHAGISEEILFRLLLLSGLLWAALLITRALWPRISATRVFWICNLFVAIAFGVAHVPAWAALTTVTASLAAVVISVNGVVALALGLVYWRWGIYAAIIAHCLADATFWGIGPSLLS